MKYSERIKIYNNILNSLRESSEDDLYDTSKTWWRKKENPYIFDQRHPQFPPPESTVYYVGPDDSSVEDTYHEPENKNSDKPYEYTDEDINFGYRLVLKGLPLDFEKANIVSKNSKSIEIEIPIKKGRVEEWKTYSYSYDEADSFEGVRFDGETIKEPDWCDEDIEGGTIYATIYDTYFEENYKKVDIENTNDEELLSIIEKVYKEDEEKRRRGLKDKSYLSYNFESRPPYNGIFGVCLSFGKGDLSVRLKPKMTFESDDEPINDSGEDCAFVYKVEIDFPKIAKNINWIYDNIDKFSDILEESLTCPNCGRECDKYDLDQYGMCYDCWEYEQENEEDEEDEDY